MELALSDPLYGVSREEAVRRAAERVAEKYVGRVKVSIVQAVIPHKLVHNNRYVRINVDTPPLP